MPATSTCQSHAGPATVGSSADLLGLGLLSAPALPESRVRFGGSHIDKLVVGQFVQTNPLPLWAWSDPRGGENRGPALRSALQGVPSPGPLRWRREPLERKWLLDNWSWHEYLPAHFRGHAS